MQRKRLVYPRASGASSTVGRLPRELTRQDSTDARPVLHGRFANSPHDAPVRVLTHIKKLDGCFGPLLVRVICDCGACREIEPEALARARSAGK